MSSYIDFRKIKDVSRTKNLLVVIYIGLHWFMLIHYCSTDLGQGMSVFVNAE